MSDQVNKKESTQKKKSNFSYSKFPIEQFRPYSKHPFRKPSGLEFEGLCASVKENGIKVFIKARYTTETDADGKEIYEIISGLSRVEAAKLAGLSTIPVQLVHMDDDEADVEVVELNYGRKNILPSELGKAFKLRLDALNRQGKRPTSPNPDQNEREFSRDEVAGMFGISGSKVHRYMRLALLIPEFQDDVDYRQIPLYVAEDISFLRKPEQTILHKLFQKNKKDLTRSKSTILKKARQKADKENQKDDFTKEKIVEMLKSSEGKAKIPRSIKIPYESIQTHINRLFEGQDLTEEKIKDIILKAVSQYQIEQ